MYAAIDALSDKLDRCVRKHKEKLQDHHAGESRSAPPVRAQPPRRHLLRRAAAVGVRIIVISGLSGSGKSMALHMLEDLGYYCIDNMPAALLKPFISYTVRSAEQTYQRTAVGLDARNTAAEIATIPGLLDELKRSGIHCEVVFLVASRGGTAAPFRRDAPQASDEPEKRVCARPSIWSAAARAHRQCGRSARSTPRAWACTICVSSCTSVSGSGRAAASRSPSSPSASSTASRAMRTSCSMRARCRIRTGSSRLRNLTGRDPEVARFLESHASVGG